MKKHLKVALAVVLATVMVILPIGTLAASNEQVMREQQLVQAVQTAFSDTPNYSNYDIGPVSNYQYSIQDYDIESTAYDSSILETEPCAIDEPMYAASSKIYDEGVITRAQWLHNLVSIFQLSLQQQNLPDFSFSDEIDSTY
ncbi:MAG: hypothetical protein IKZ82_00545, partial [Clostridia bacterium]|nr:hypothetical protein [Clostridia bacterium]